MAASSSPEFVVRIVCAGSVRTSSHIAASVVGCRWASASSSTSSGWASSDICCRRRASSSTPTSATSAMPRVPVPCLMLDSSVSVRRPVRTGVSTRSLISGGSCSAAARPPRPVRSQVDLGRFEPAADLVLLDVGITGQAVVHQADLLLELPLDRVGRQRGHALDRGPPCVSSRVLFEVAVGAKAEQRVQSAPRGQEPLLGRPAAGRRRTSTSRTRRWRAGPACRSPRGESAGGRPPPSRTAGTPPTPARATPRSSPRRSARCRGSRPAAGRPPGGSRAPRSAPGRRGPCSRWRWRRAASSCRRCSRRRARWWDRSRRRPTSVP